MVVLTMKHMLVTILVACVTMLMLTPTVQATRDPLVSIQRPNPPPDSQFENPYKWFGLGPWAGGSDLDKCWKPLDDVKDCHSQIITSLINQEIRLGEFCCEIGIPKVTNKCWKKMFPLFPEFKNLLIQWCITDP